MDGVGCVFFLSTLLNWRNPILSSVASFGSYLDNRGLDTRGLNNGGAGSLLRAPGGGVVDNVGGSGGNSTGREGSKSSDGETHLEDWVGGKLEFVGLGIKLDLRKVERIGFSKERNAEQRGLLIGKECNRYETGMDRSTSVDEERGKRAREQRGAFLYNGVFGRRWSLGAFGGGLGAEAVAVAVDPPRAAQDGLGGAGVCTGAPYAHGPSPFLAAPVSLIHISTSTSRLVCPV